MLILCGSVAAGRPSPELTPSAGASGSVVFTISGIMIVKDGGSILNHPLLQSLANDQTLVEFDLTNVSATSAGYTCMFSFPTMDAFTGWYNSPATRKLLDDLRDLSRSFNSSLTMKRQPSTDEGK
jgi:hypothetical protein